MPLNQTANVTNALVEAYGIATEKRHEFLTPEHLIAGYLKDRDFWDTVSGCARAEELEKNIYGYLNELDSTPDSQDLEIEFSSQLQELFDTAAKAATGAMVDTLQTHHLIYAIFHLEDSYARFHLENCLECSIPEFLNSLIGMGTENVDGMQENLEERWMRYFTEVEPYSGLVGRKEETARIIRVLCRKTKSNALIVGGRGVGKSAMAKGIAHLLVNEEVPDKIKGYSLMELNTGVLLSGTQYRGDLEGRVQTVMEAVSKEEGVIVYIDELRSLGGMNRMDDGSKDILTLLIPYFKSGKVKFIISATPEDIKKLTTHDVGVLGLFRQIEIEEPSSIKSSALSIPQE